MKKIFGLVVSLTVISGVCAAVLAYVNEVTKAPIAETAKADELAAVRAVMPQDAVSVEKLEGVTGAFVGKTADGRVAGYAAKGRDAGGYGGDIVLMVGFGPDRKTVVCYRTLTATETPGLGMKLKTPEFAGQFAGRDGSSLSVKKDGGEIEAITSATITSRAVCRAIAAATAALKP